MRAFRAGLTLEAMAQDPFDSDAAFPRLGEEVLAVLDAAGERRPLVKGEVLYRAGDPSSDFFVVVRGRVAVMTASDPRRRALQACTGNRSKVPFKVPS